MALDDCCAVLKSDLHVALLYVIAVDPPGDEGLVCETRDLASAECSWKKGRDTHLRMKRSRTKYTLNGRQETHYTRTTDRTRYPIWLLVMSSVHKKIPKQQTTLNDMENDTCVMQCIFLLLIQEFH